MATFASSGIIYLGNQFGVSDSRSIGKAKGKSTGAQVSLNDSDIRSFAGKFSGTIKMSDFYGRSYGDLGDGGDIISKPKQK